MTSSTPHAGALGSIIRRQRELAALPMRQLAAAVGISNPYLSQIERGLRAPSEAVLHAIADSLQTTAEALYTEAGFVHVPQVDDDERPSVLQRAIDSAADLTTAQRRALTEVYRAFVDANRVARTTEQPAGDRHAASDGQATGDGYGTSDGHPER